MYVCVCTLVCMFTCAYILFAFMNLHAYQNTLEIIIICSYMSIHSSYMIESEQHTRLHIFNLVNSLMVNTRI